jgi:hypothetical protein
MPSNGRRPPQVALLESPKRVYRNHFDREFSDGESARGYTYCAGYKALENRLRMAFKPTTSVFKHNKEMT